MSYRVLGIFGETDNCYYHNGSSLIEQKIHDVIEQEQADWFCEQIRMALESAALHIGDTILKFVADEAQKTIRKDDILARIGGEEFIILMKNTTKQEAFVFAERLRKHIESSDLHAFNCAQKLTISLGITEESPPKSSLDELFKRVDQALYEAKNRGRNASVVF